jgi:hypothetical protein
VYTPRETDEINFVFGVLEPYHSRLNKVYRILCKHHTNTAHTWYNHEEVQDVNQQQEQLLLLKNYMAMFMTAQIIITASTIRF